MLIHNHNGLLLWRIEESEAELSALVTADDRASAARFISAARRREHLAWRAALRTAIPVGEVLYDANGAPYIHRSVILSEANCERSEQSPSERRPSRPQGAGEASCERGNDLKANPALRHSEPPSGGVESASEASLYVGVSHTRDLAAVILSDRKCAVDVERLDRDFSKTRSRFISESEERLVNSGDPNSAAAGKSEQLFAAAVWCAKETLYKLAGRRELDLLRDIAITRCGLPNGTITSCDPPNGTITSCGLPHGTITGSILNSPPITLHAQIVEQWIVVWGEGSGVS